MATVGSPYESEVRGLLASTEPFGYGVVVERPEQPAPPYSWIKANALKPRLLLRHLKEGVNVLWLDADAVVKQKLTLFDEDRVGDFAACRHYRGAWMGGTLWFKSTPKVIEHVEVWRDISETEAFGPGGYEGRRVFGNPKGRASSRPRNEQEVLTDLVDNKGWMQPHKLPQAYCRIFDGRAYDSSADDPVIVHNQASRRFKREVELQTWKQS